jgi:hypothetical protein
VRPRWGRPFTCWRPLLRISMKPQNRSTTTSRTYGAKGSIGASKENREGVAEAAHRCPRAAHVYGIALARAPAGERTSAERAIERVLAAT